MFCILSMSALNVLSRHLGGLPCLPLRLVLTAADRAILVRYK